MNTTTRTLCTTWILALGMAGGISHAQSSSTDPSTNSKETQSTGHEGHNHAEHAKQAEPGGVAPAKLIEVQPGTPSGGVQDPLMRSILLFKSTSVSTGEILDIEPATIEFEFKNTGSEDLVIRLIKPSCGCTIPELEKKTYAPGENGVIKVTFDPSGKRGTISRNISVFTNSETKPVHTIFVKSLVKPAVVIEPRIMAFDMTQKGHSATKDFSIYGRFPEFKINRATSQNSETFAIEIIDGGSVEKDGETLWLQKIRVTILESAKPNSHRTEISVRTNDEHKPIFSLQVVGRVIGDLELTPVRMTMGRIVVGDSFEKQVTLRSKSGKAFEVKSVNSANVVLDAAYTATPVDPEMRNEWVIKVAGTVIHPAQRFNAQLNVVTDMADEEMMTIQMYGQLQPKKP